jgi:hypothetical protein
MFAHRLVVRLASILLLLALSMPTIEAAQAAGPVIGAHPACMRCGGGGGGGGQLTQAEIDGLLYMREEEKLARDSYWTLYAQWHLSIFSKIASSEVMHMSKIKGLLDRYGLPDPAAGKAVGEFSNPILQQLYDDLMVQGSQSSIEALKVGVAIEEVDIQDLKNYLAQTNKLDIINAYNALLNGSYCHLRAFNNQLGQ